VAKGERVPPGLDVTKPNIARVYDAFLGGRAISPPTGPLSSWLYK
jgi:hypothetical protein